MEIDLNNPRGGSRRRHSQLRLLEKQIRSEIFERCLQFIDVIINQIIYQENIYPSNLFISCQIDLFSQQLSDMISINIIRNFQIPIILRRYLIELHTIHDPCLRAVYDNRKQLINQIDQAFAHCIQTIKQIKPLENHNFNKQWTFQLRLCPNEKNNKKDYSKETNVSSSVSKKSNESELWLLTTTNNPPICTIDDQDMKSSDIEEKSKDKNRQNKNKGTIINADLFIDHYHLTQRTDRENFDALQYSSEDEDQPQSPYSPDNVWQEEDNDEDEDL
ncbi:unnamed protein product [Rotaria sordida]|uniref:Uncharacterized protein n=1 Tax=Rotaria sordida TaxID=392033 RepID=A0A814I6S2_9BILA|nr:unnamed protein product [Rotaria sordida]